MLPLLSPPFKVLFLLFYPGNVGTLPFVELLGGRADQFLILFSFFLPWVYVIV